MASLSPSKTIAILGYGIQGRAQALNLKDKSFSVIVGQRKGSPKWQQALDDGWSAGENLFELPEAIQQADILCYLLSDVGQVAFWPHLKEHLKPGHTLVFAHGFALTYSAETGVIPPQGIDVILVAPKGSGRSLREKFLIGEKLDCALAVHQDASGHALQTAKELAAAIGGGHTFQTTIDNETKSDLFSERGIILGAMMGLMNAQYKELRANGHSHEEAYSDTVYEVTQWLMPMVGQIGYDGVLKNCSSVAKWGALKWAPEFEKTLAPLFAKLYQDVASGSEAREVLEGEKNGTLQAKIDTAFEELKNQDLWRLKSKSQD